MDKKDNKDKTDKKDKKDNKTCSFRIYANLSDEDSHKKFQKPNFEFNGP